MTGEHKPGDENVYVVMLTLFMAALLAIFREKCSAYIDLPLTIGMFLIGMAFGGIMYASKEFHDMITITSISPTLIFHIFLPVLIFDGAQGLKLRTLSSVKWQVFWLAGPGLLIYATLVSLFMWIFVDWGWWGRLLFGAMLSATDPVAVIAVLKDLDADNWISTLIDGEAIANDGAAIIVFHICYGGFVGETEDFGHWWYYLLVAWLLVGAPILGTILAAIFIPILRAAHNAPVIEATITLAAAYVGFVLAEDYVQTSGVLTLFALGYHLSKQHGSQLWKSEVSEHAWEVIVFAANAVLFALVGCLIALEAIPHAEPFDWALLVFVYLALHVFRISVVTILWPLLGEMNIPRAALLICGALRGGVALTLALVVQRDHRVDHRVGNQILFLTAGVVVLTIVINGTGSKQIVSRLGLNIQPRHKVFLSQRLEAAVRYSAVEALRMLQGRHAELRHFHKANWVEVHEQTVNQFVDIHEYKATQNGETRSRAGSPAPSHHHQQEGAPNNDSLAQNGSGSSPFNESGSPVSPVGTGADAKIRSVTEEEFILISLRTMKSKLWSLRAANLVGADAFMLLQELLDKHISEGNFLDPIVIQNACWEKPACLRVDVCGIKAAQDAIYYDALMTYSEMLHSLDSVLATMLSTSKRSDICAEGSLQLRTMTDEMIKVFEDEHPEIAGGMQTNRVILRTLSETKESLRDMYHTQGIPKPAFEHFEEMITELAYDAAHRDPLDIELVNEENVLANCMLFRNAKNRKEKIQQVLAENERFMFKQGDPVQLTGLGIVLKGTVVKAEKPPYQYFPSDLFGLMNVLTGVQPYGYYAQKDSVCLMLSVDSILRLVSSDSELLEHMWRSFGKREAEVALSKYFPCCTFPNDDIRRIAANGVIRAFGDCYTVTPGSRAVFLLHGRDTTGHYSHECIRLLPHLSEITFEPNTILFVIENYSMQMASSVPETTHVPLIDAASINYHALLLSLHEAVHTGVDVVDKTLGLLMDYCEKMGCALFYLLPHASNPRGTSTKVHESRRSEEFDRNSDSPFASLLAQQMNPEARQRASPYLDINSGSQEQEMDEYVSPAAASPRVLRRHLPFGEEEHEVAFNPEKILQDWKTFCKMLQRMILERFHQRVLEGQGLLNNVVWWYQRLTHHLPSLAVHFRQHPHASFYTLYDLCSEEESKAYWKHFRFAFSVEEVPQLAEWEIDEVVGTIRETSAQASPLVLSARNASTPPPATSSPSFIA